MDLGRPTAGRALAGRARRRAQRGAAAVEFALVVIPLLALMLGVIQFGYYFFSSQSASSAARETARRMIVGDCTNQTDALHFATQQANVHNLSLTFGAPGAGRYDVTSPGSMPAVGQVLRVVVTADANTINFVPLPNGGQVRRVVDARVEDANPSGAAC
jgi:Flp pilus assembly protein TadG